MCSVLDGEDFPLVLSCWWFNFYQNHKIVFSFFSRGLNPPPIAVLKKARNFGHQKRPQVTVRVSKGAKQGASLKAPGHRATESWVGLNPTGGNRRGMLGDNRRPMRIAMDSYKNRPRVGDVAVLPGPNFQMQCTFSLLKSNCCCLEPRGIQHYLRW